MTQPTFHLTVEDLHCASCAATVRSTLMARDLVEDVVVDVQTGRATVTGSIDPALAARLVTGVGYPAHPESAGDGQALHSRMEHHAQANARQWRRRSIIGLGVWVPMAVLHWAGPSMGLEGAWVPWVMGVAATAVVVLVGPGFFSSAWAAARHRTTNMDTLISIGAGTAWLYSIVLFVMMLAGVDHVQPLYFTEAAALLGLISLGHWLEARSSARAGSAIRALLELQPETAHRVTADGTEEVPVGSIARGDQLLVRPGDRIPVDGTVIEGDSEIDESLISGEPLPVRRTTGDTVVSGALNTVGRLVVQADVAGHESTVARIAALVSDALGSRASIQRLADTVSSIFVPAVLIVAAATVVGWTIRGAVLDDWTNLSTGIIAAVTVLIISCPCALGLATPMAIMVGAGEAGRRGILIKTASALERGGTVGCVVFDKTGTLTEGRPVVVSITPEGDRTEDDVIRTAWAAEAASEHPVARAIGEVAAERGIEALPVEEFSAIPGTGVRAVLDGSMIVVRRDEQAACAVLVDGERIGRIDVRDRALPDAADAVTSLKHMGLEVAMLSGDRPGAALEIAGQVGIDPASVTAGVTPEEKAAHVRNADRPTIMVGDGINDAAALATATVGAAVGSGTNVAIDAADVVIPAHRPSAVPELIWIGRRTLRTIKQNLFFAFVYNTAMIPLAAFGLLGPWGPLIAAGAMAASDITVVGNAVRLGRSLRHGTPR